MCAICGFTKCPSGCPNAEPVICDHFCSVCGYGIEFGEEYIVNDNDNYAHIEWSEIFIIHSQYLENK